MAKFFEPPQEAVNLVESVISKWHHHLLEADIGVLFRDVAQKVGEITVMGQAKKVSPDMQAAGCEFDFILIFADDVWQTLTPEQKEALVDHECCHCLHDGEKAKLRPHDFEEFNEVIERHGLWWPGAQETARVIQGHTMPLFGRQGRVAAVSDSSASVVLGEGD